MPVNKTRFPVWLPYLVAVVLVGLVLAARLAFGFNRESDPVLSLFLLPVLAAAFLGGWWPGVAATLLAALVTDYFLLPPLPAFGISAVFDIFQWSALIVEGLLISAVCQALHRQAGVVGEQAALLDRAQVLVRDAADRIVYWNSGAEALYGWTRDEAVGRVTHELFHTQFPDSLEAYYAQLAAHGRWVGELTRTRKDGTPIVVVSHQVLQRDARGQPSRSLEVDNDITERKRAEEALRASEQRYAVLFDKAAIPASLTKLPENVFVDVNEAFEGAFGFSKQELIGKTSLEMGIARPDEQRQTVAAVQASGAVNDAEKHLFTKAGQARIATVNVNVVELDGQRFALTTIYDITERKQAEEKLRESEERFAKIFHASSMGINIFRLSDGRAFDANEAYLEMVGYARDEVIGHTAAELNLFVDPRARAAWLTALGARQRITSQDARLRRKSGELRDMLASLEVIDVNGEPMGLVLVLDVTERRQAQAQVQYQANLLQNVSDAIIGADPDARIASWNPGAEALYGWKAAEVVGRQTRDVLQTRYAGGDGEQVLRQFNVQGSWQGEVVQQHKDGSRRDIMVSVSIARDVDGQAIGSVAVNRDISARKRAEAALRAQTARLELLADVSRAFAETQLDLQALLDLAARKIAQALGDNCAILLLTDDGQWLTLATFYDIDPQALTFMQSLAPAAMLRADEPNVVQPALHSAQPLLMPALKLAQMRSSVPPEFWPLLEQASEDSRLLARMTAGGEIIGLLGIARRKPGWPPFGEQDLRVARDLADRTALAIAHARLFQRIQILNAELEERVTQRTEQLLAANDNLSAARDEAQRANQAKSDFLSRMSHELRTPLNAILGFAQILEMDRPSPGQQEAVHHILSGGQHLLALINEVLDIARIEAGRLSLSPEPVRAGDVVQEALELVEPMAAGRNILLEVVGLPEIHLLVDHQRIKQVLLNLLSNAVKYNRDGGRVTVSGRALPNRSGEMRFRLSVTDSGPGISAAKLGRLFQAFDRLDADATDVPGTGLGLALSKSLVEAMGGTLGVESAIDEGSTFWVDVPVTEAPIERVKRTGALALPEAPAAQTRTVMYVEDNLSNLQLVEQILSYRPGIHLLTVMQGGLSVELAREHQPNLILLDLNLPDMHGSRVLELLQADPRTRAIPVVIISADATPGQIERLQLAGARTYLTKPLDVRQFLDVVDGLLAS